MEKMSREDRARQFMPFAALKGYDDAVKEKERVVCEKDELTEERIEKLSQTVAKITKGVVVKVKYYKTDSYVTEVGTVTAIDFTMRYLKIIKTTILFDDLYEIEIVK